jgi:hypothetical protein
LVLEGDTRRTADHAGRTLFVLTRSSAILDLEVTGQDDTILYCPANHSPPLRVLPFPGSAGYEAVATCLASPEVRARTQGVMAVCQPSDPATVGMDG